MQQCQSRYAAAGAELVSAQQIAVVRSIKHGCDQEDPTSRID